MSLVFSQTVSPYNGVVQRAEVMVYGEDGLGRISGNTIQLGLWTTRFNNALDKIHERILQKSGYQRQSDDSNHTDFNTIYTDLVSGQDNYTFTTDENGNLILDLYRPYAKTSTGYYQPLELADELSDPDFYSESGITGDVPYKYAKKTDTAILVRPTPNANVTNGLKFEISREPSHFITTDTTKKPGFRATLHELIPVYAVLEYGEDNALTNAQFIERRAQRLEMALDKACGNLAPDERAVMRGKRISYI